MSSVSCCTDVRVCVSRRTQKRRTHVTCATRDPYDATQTATPETLHSMHRISRRNGIITVIGLAAAITTHPTSADTTSAIATAYDGYASTYDNLDGSAFMGDTLGLDATRSGILQIARGDVLELGVGTGLNLPGYDYSKIKSLTAVDISQGMLDKSTERADGLGLGRNNNLDSDDVDTKQKNVISFSIADAENLPFADDTFDSVVDTFSLCVMNDPLKALMEVKRVLKPGGVALLSEHQVSNDNPLLATYQNLTEPLVTKMSKGCVWNQDVLAMVKDAGLKVQSVKPSLGGLLVTLEASK